MTAESVNSEKKEYKSPQGVNSEISWSPGAKGAKHKIEVTSEWIVLRKKEKPAAEIFHTYYRMGGAKAARPITFVFNGGPGAASAYLHLGGLGPAARVF